MPSFEASELVELKLGNVIRGFWGGAKKNDSSLQLSAFALLLQQPRVKKHFPAC